MRVKVTEESNQAAAIAAEKLQEEISERNQFLSLLKVQEVSVFWAMVTKDMDARIESLVNYRDAHFKTMTESEIKINVGQEAAFRVVKNIPKGAERVRDQQVKERNKILERLHERTTRSKG